MATADVEREVAELRAEIDRHNRLYYVEAKPEIPDREFDKLLTRLSELEQAHPEYDRPDSPTHRVGGEAIEGFQTIKHSVPMLSIDNTYSEADVREWWDRMQRALAEINGGNPGKKSKKGSGPSLFGGGGEEDGDQPLRCYCDPKIDGVALSIRYEDGAFAYAVSPPKEVGRRPIETTPSSSVQ